MTKREGAIIGAFTGCLIGDFSDLHKYVEEIMGRPVFTHEMASENISSEIKKQATSDFMAICKELGGRVNEGAY